MAQPAYLATLRFGTTTTRSNAARDRGTPDTHDAHPWLDYFWGVLIRAYSEFEERVESLKGSKTDQVRAAVTRRLGAFGIADIEHDCPGVSRDMVRYVLRQCERRGAFTSKDMVAVRNGGQSRDRLAPITAVWDQWCLPFRLFSC